MQELIKEVTNEIDIIYYKYKNIIEGSDVRYVIAYLDEIEGSIKRYFNGKKLLQYMIKSKKESYDFRKIINSKLYYWNLKYMMNFYQKKLYLMFDNLDMRELKGLVKPKLNSEFECNKDNHNISNRIEYYISKNKIIDLKDMKRLDYIMKNDLEKIIHFTIKFLGSIKFLSEEKLIKIFKKNIVSLKKYNINDIAKKLCLNKQNIEINDKDLNLEITKYINIISNTTIDIQENILIYDSIFRMYEANHLITIDKELNNNFEEFQNNNFEEIQFFYDDILVNMAVCLISASYDKIGKEIIGSYFSKMFDRKNYKNIKNIYISYDYIRRNIEDFDEIYKISREVFEIKNTLMHRHIPGRLLLNNELEMYKQYKIILIKYNCKIILRILNFMIKNKIYI